MVMGEGAGGDFYTRSNLKRCSRTNSAGGNFSLCPAEPQAVILKHVTQRLYSKVLVVTDCKILIACSKSF